MTVIETDIMRKRVGLKNVRRPKPEDSLPLSFCTVVIAISRFGLLSYLRKISLDELKKNMLSKIPIV